MRNQWNKKIVNFLNVGIVFSSFALQSCQFNNITPPVKASPEVSFIDTIIPAPSGLTFYVDGHHGSDANSGAQSSPWQTIQKAADNMPEDGIAIVLEGTYSERVVITRPSLTFRAQGEVLMQGFSIQADYATISGFTIVSLTDDVPTGIGIDVPNAGFCIIENNRFLFNTWGGLRLMGSLDDPDASHDCIVRDNVFFRNAMFAAEIRGQNHLIENNNVSHTIQHHPCSSSTAIWLDADGFRFHGSGHVFRGNNIHDMPFGQKGFDTASCDLENLADLSKDFVSNAHIDCFQTYGGDRIAGHDILFEANRCELPRSSEWVEDGIGAKAFQGSSDAHNLTISNNLVIADMLSLFLHGCYDITITHNTFIGSGDAHAQGLKFENCFGNIQIKNNVFYGQENGIGHIWLVNTPVDAGYNCIFRANGSPSRPADSGDIWDIDPQLDSGYRLSSISPCIDTGTDMGVSIDFDGKPRPQGGGFDIGAFEFAIP